MKSKRRLQRGGEVAIKFAKPEVSETSANSAIKGSMQNQKENNAEMTKMNKEMAGGGKDSDVTVPQMDQAGDSGNASITGGIGNILKGAADSEFDGDIQQDSAANSDYTGGRRKSHRKKRRTRRRRKSKKRRKSRRKKSGGRKSRRKTRRRRKSKKSRKSRRRTRRRKKGGLGGLTKEDVAIYNKKKMSRPKEMISDAMAANLKRREHKKEAKRLGVADFITIG